MAAAKRCPPENDLTLINIYQVASMGYGGFPIVKLAADIQQLTRVTLALPKVAIVKHQAGIACCHKTLSVCPQAHLARTAKAVRHHHNWKGA